MTDAEKIRELREKLAIREVQVAALQAEIVDGLRGRAEHYRRLADGIDGMIEKAKQTTEEPPAMVDAATVQRIADRCAGKIAVATSHDQSEEAIQDFMNDISDLTDKA